MIRQDSQKMDREDLTNRKEIIVQSKLTKSIELVDHLVLWMAMICTSINDMYIYQYQYKYQRFFFEKRI